MNQDRQKMLFDKEQQWRFDGHGVNCDGERKLTLSTSPYDGKTRNPQHGYLGDMLSEFLSESHRLAVERFHEKEPPTIFLGTTIEELKHRGSNHVLAVEVTREDGKAARLHVTLDYFNGRLKASIKAMGREHGNETSREVSAKFADWS